MLTRPPFSIVSLFGILIGSSSTLIFGEYIWSPLALMEAFLDKFPTKATRAGVAIISICFIVARESRFLVLGHVLRSHRCYRARNQHRC